MVLVLCLNHETKNGRILYNSHVKREEDFHIASMMAEYYGFTLNEAIAKDDLQSYSPIESFAERSLNAIFFEKEIYTRNENSVVPTLAFGGFGGGISRGYQENLNKKQILKNKSKTIHSLKCFLQIRKMQYNTQKILRRSIQAIDNMLKEANAPLQTSAAINGLQFYMETRNRSHFGMGIARRCLTHSYAISPLLDPLFLMLCPPPQGQHPLLITAIIYTRYCDGLASFPIEGGRSIPEETLNLAKELNKSFPKENRKGESIQAAASPVWQILQNEDSSIDIDRSHPLGDDPPAESKNPWDLRLRKAYKTETVQKLLYDVYGKSLDLWINPKLDKRHPYANQYAAVAIAKALNDIQCGKDAPSDFADFIKKCCE